MNFALSHSKFAVIFFALLAVSFLWMSIFGLLHHMSLMQGGSMDGCLFNGQAGVCTMNFSDHVDVWQSMLTFLPREAGVLVLVLVAAFIASLFFINRFLEYLAFRFRLYSKEHPQAPIFNYLRREFSLGILNPKIFSLAF